MACIPVAVSSFVCGLRCSRELHLLGVDYTPQLLKIRPCHLNTLLKVMAAVAMTDKEAQLVEHI